MKVASMSCSNPEQLRNEISALIKDAFVPTLAVIFTSVSQDIDKIKSIFSGLNLDVIGCTTAGEMVDDHLYEGSIAVLLMDIDRNYYKILLEQYDDPTIYETAHKIGKRAKEYFKNPGILLQSSGLSINAQLMLNGFRDGVGHQIPIYGGLAGDDLKMSRTIVFTDKITEEQGISVLVLDTDKVTINGLATSGWEPVGVEQTITKAKGNKVYTINGEAAYTVFTRYFGFPDTLSTEEDKLLMLQTNYPLQFIRKEGHTVLISPLLMDPKEGSITLAATAKEGDKFKFSYSPGFEVIEQTIEEFGKLKETTSNADAIILFSCKGRHGAFGPLLEKEIHGIYNYWKKPMIGFLSYGEIGDIGTGLCEFQNETCSLVILKEK